MSWIYKAIIIVFLFKISQIDWVSKKIHNADLLGLLFEIVVYFLALRIPVTIDKIIGILIISMPMLFITVLRPGSFGGGDIKLMAICGFLLGREEIMQAALISLFAAATYATWLLFLEKRRKTEFALGPFICLGVIIVFLEIF